MVAHVCALFAEAAMGDDPSRRALLERVLSLVVEHACIMITTSERAIERSSDRAPARSSGQSSVRSSERSSDRASRERQNSRASDRVSERPSDRGTERSGKRLSCRAIGRPSDRAFLLVKSNKNKGVLLCGEFSMHRTNLVFQDHSTACSTNLKTSLTAEPCNGALTEMLWFCLQLH